MKVGNWEIISDSDVNEKIDFKKKMMQHVSGEAPTPWQPYHPGGHSGHSSCFSQDRDRFWLEAA